MGIKRDSEQWDLEYRGFRGVDRRTDRSLITADYLANSDNIVLKQGVPETRKGSSLWGSLDLTAIVGTRRQIFPVDVGADQYILFHIGTKLYSGLKASAAPTVIQNLAAVPADLAAADAESEFLDLGFNYGTNGELIRKVLFKQAAACLVLEYNSATAAWKGMAPGIDIAPVSFTMAEVAGGTNQVLGTYRVRVVARRAIQGVRFQESAPTSKDAVGADIGWQEIAITSPTNRIQVTLSYTAGLDPQVTEFAVHVTKNLNFVGGSAFSDNGNDPTLYFETATTAKAASPMTIYVDTTDLNVPTPDLFLYDTLPGHLLSVYAGGVLFFGGVNGAQSRIYKAGISGLFYHSGLYDTTEYYTADEGDGQLLTALEIVGDHLAVWKEKKTGIVANKDLDGNIIWRDRRVGCLHRKAVGIISEDEAVVLCHDGILRLFSGVEYSGKKSIGDDSFDVSDKVRTLTKLIDPSTVTYIWHEERLHLLYGASGARQALVLHPREDFGWTPWSGLEHELNGLVDNDNTWLFLYDNRLYEQSPAGEVYTDFGDTDIAWSIAFAALHPKDRLNKIWMQYCFVEGYYSAIYNATFRCDGGFIETAAVDAVPNPELPEFSYVQWFGLFPAAQVYGHFIELTLEGTGKAIFRAVRWRVIERLFAGAGWSMSAELGAYAFLPLWASLEILYLRFDVDSAIAKDYSGNRRDHTFAAGTGGARAFLSGLIPGGGQAITKGIGSGYSDPDWDGLDYIGLLDGLNSASLTFEYVFELSSLAAPCVLQEAGDGTKYWTMKVLADGSLEFTLVTDGGSAVSKRFYTAAGVAITGVLYTLQFVLSNGGLNGQFYFAPRSSAFAEIITLSAAV